MDGLVGQDGGNTFYNVKYTRINDIVRKSQGGGDGPGGVIDVEGRSNRISTQ